MNRKHKYGINVRKWCKEHERYIEEELKGQSDDMTALLAMHEKKLSWLMHERLIHLLVLFITVILTLFSLSLVLFLPDLLPASLIMFVIVFILLIFYVRHYFFLENTVQYWYVLSEKIENKK